MEALSYADLLTKIKAKARYGDPIAIDSNVSGDSGNWADHFKEVKGIIKGLHSERNSLCGPYTYKNQDYAFIDNAKDSLGAINDIVDRIQPCNCDVKKEWIYDCSTRIGCTCDVRTSDCVTRTTCDCHTRTADCSSRTTCTCDSRTSDCPSRTTCTCNYRTSDCVARTACSCNSRDSDCVTRTASDCTSRECSGVSTYACTCNARSAPCTCDFVWDTDICSCDVRANKTGPCPTNCTCNNVLRRSYGSASVYGNICSCNVRTANCETRVADECPTRTGSCGGRTADECPSRESLCATRIADECPSRTGSCESRTTCNCDARESVCASRTADECPSRTAECGSRTACICDTHCTCDMVTEFS